VLPKERSLPLKKPISPEVESRMVVTRGWGVAGGKNEERLINVNAVTDRSRKL
jgi:hypothetical protein